MAYDTTEGTLIRGADGELYFIRDEILEACKVTEDDMKEFCDGLVDRASREAETEGFAFRTGRIADSVSLRGPFQQVGTESGIPDLGQVASTVMCPGTMGLADFDVVNPVIRE